MFFPTFEGIIFGSSEKKELRQLFVLLPAIIEDGEGWVALFFLIFPKYNWQIQCSYSISLIFAFFVMFVWQVYKQKIRKTYSIPFLFWDVLLNCASGNKKSAIAVLLSIGTNVNNVCWDKPRTFSSWLKVFLNFSSWLKVFLNFSSWLAIFPPGPGRTAPGAIQYSAVWYSC